MTTPRIARAALLAALAGAPAWAQPDKPLDLRLPKDDGAGSGVCKVCGEVRSIREIHVGLSRGVETAIPTEYVGSRSDIDGSRQMVVGAAMVLPLGAGSGDRGWRIGTAGTPEAQARLGDVSYEITVVMDGGEHRTLQRRDGSRFRAGQRVTLRSGELEPMFD